MTPSRGRALTGGRGREDLRFGLLVEELRRELEVERKSEPTPLDVLEVLADFDRQDAVCSGGYEWDATTGELYAAADVGPVVEAVEDLGECEGGGYLVDTASGDVLTTVCASTSCAKHMHQKAARRLAEVLLGFAYSFADRSQDDGVVRGRTALLTLTWPTKPAGWTWGEYVVRMSVDVAEVRRVYESYGGGAAVGRVDLTGRAVGEMMGELAAPAAPGGRSRPERAIYARENVISGQETVWLLSWQWAKLRSAHYNKWARSMDYCANIEATGQGVLHTHASLPVPAEWSVSVAREDRDAREEYRRWLLSEWCRIVPGARGTAQSMTFEGEAHVRDGFEDSYSHRSPATAVAYQTAWHEFQGKHPMPKRYEGFRWHRWKRSRSWRNPYLGDGDRFAYRMVPVDDVEGLSFEDNERRYVDLSEVRDQTGELEVKEAVGAGLSELLDNQADHWAALDLFEYRRQYGWVDYWTLRRTLQGSPATLTPGELADEFPVRWAAWELVSWEYSKRPRHWRYVSSEDGKALEPTERVGPAQPTILWPDGRIEALRNGASYIDSDAILPEWRADIRAGRKSVKASLELERPKYVREVETLLSAVIA